MTTVTGTFTGAAVSSVLNTADVPQTLDWSLAGTWTTPGGGIELQREVTPGAGAWETIAGPYTADASGVYVGKANDRFRFYSELTTGSVVYSVADRTETLLAIKDAAGNAVVTYNETGAVFPADVSVGDDLSVTGDAAVTGNLTFTTAATAAGTVGTGTTAGTASLPVDVSTGAGGAKTGTGTADGGASGRIVLATGDGGATASTSGATGGAAGNTEITLGAGGAASAGTSNGGKGGSFVLTPGAGGTSAGGTAGNAGQFFLRGPVAMKRSVTAMTTTATITAAALLGGIITANQGGAGAATYTMPTGTAFQAALPGDYENGDSWEFSVTNISTDAAEDVTVAGDTGMTLVGSGVIASNAAATDRSAATFVIIRTGANAFSFYRKS